MVSSEAAQFIQDFTKIYQPIKEKCYEDYFLSSTYISDEHTRQAEESSLKLQRLFLDQDKAKTIKTFLSLNIPHHELLHKQLTDLDVEFELSLADKNDVEEEIKQNIKIEEKFNKHVYTLKGQTVTSNDLKEILKKSVDQTERQEAWEELMSVGEAVHQEVITIAKLRNRIAQQLGYDNYYSMSLKRQKIDENWLFSILDKLYHSTQKQYGYIADQMHRYIMEKFKISESEICSYHYSDCFLQTVEPIGNKVDLDEFFQQQDVIELTKIYYEGIGLTIDDIIANSDLYEREQKQQQGAYCLTVNINNIKTMMNIRPNEYWMGTSLHELGHAVSYKYINQELPYLLQEVPHTNSTEAIAMMFGKLTKEPEFLEKIAGVPHNIAQQLKDTLYLQTAGEQLVFSRWVMVIANFERELYHNPDQDLNTLWYDLKRKYQLEKVESNRHKPDWAAKIHVAAYPVYYHNYLIGEMIASQTEQYIRTRITGTAETPGTMINHKGIGQYLIKKVFNEGACREWNESLEYATGEKLNINYYLRQYVDGLNRFIG